MPSTRKTGETLTLAALCLMLASVPLAYLPLPFLYPYPIYEYALLPKTFALHACVTLALLGWLLQAPKGARFVSGPLLLPLLCYAGVALLSAYASTHPLDTLVELLNLAGLVALALVAANALPAGRLRPLLWTNAAAGLCVALIGILQYHDLAFTGIPSNGPPGATFGYRNFAAMYLVCAIPLSALLFFTARGTAGAILSGAATALMAAFLAYTRTRGAWAGLAGALALTGGAVLLNAGLRRSFLDALGANLTRTQKILLPACIALFAILAPLPARFTDTGLQRFDEKKADIATALTSAITEQGDRGRKAMWANTLGLIADHPLLGVGPGGWKRAYPPYDNRAMIRRDSSPRRPHNDYLWIAAEHGLLGLGVYLWLLLAAFREILALARRPEPFWRIAAPLIAVSLLATLGHALFSFPKERPQAAMFPYLLFGLVAAATARRRVAPSPRTLGPLLVSLLLLLSAAAAELARRQILFDRHYLNALIAEDRDDWEAVSIQADRALAWGAFRPHALVVKARAQEKRRWYGEAEALYRRALAYAPHAWHAHNGLGVVLKRQGRYEEALSHYEKALGIFPGAQDALNNLGALYKSMGDRQYRATGRLDSAGEYYNRAQQAYLKVLRRNPADASAHNNLGNLYKARGQLDSAAVHYERALEIDPDQPQAHYNLADLYRRQERFEDAISHYRTAVRLTPEEPRVYWGLGQALELNRNIFGAEAAYRKAIELHPEFAEAHFSLGSLLFDLARFHEAKAAFQTFLDLWKGPDRYAQFARGRIEASNKRLGKIKK